MKTLKQILCQQFEKGIFQNYEVAKALEAVEKWLTQKAQKIQEEFDNGKMPCYKQAIINDFIIDELLEELKQ
jgi:hypothetical protein